MNEMFDIVCFIKLFKANNLDRNAIIDIIEQKLLCNKLLCENACNKLIFELSNKLIEFGYIGDGARYIGNRYMNFWNKTENQDIKEYIQEKLVQNDILGMQNGDPECAWRLFFIDCDWIDYTQENECYQFLLNRLSSGESTWIPDEFKRELLWAIIAELNEKYEEMFEKYKKASNSKDNWIKGYAFCHMGWCYLTGQGVEKNKEIAKEMFEKSSKCGYFYGKQKLLKLEKE